MDPKSLELLKLNEVSYGVVHIVINLDYDYF